MAEQRIQQYQVIRYQIPSQQLTYVYQLISGYQSIYRPPYIYESQFKPNKHQPTPIQISNLAHPTLKITAIDID